MISKSVQGIVTYCYKVGLLLHKYHGHLDNGYITIPSAAAAARISLLHLKQYTNPQLQFQSRCGTRSGLHVFELYEESIIWPLLCNLFLPKLGRPQ